MLIMGVMVAAQGEAHHQGGYLEGSPLTSPQWFKIASAIASGLFKSSCGREQFSGTVSVAIIFNPWESLVNKRMTKAGARNFNLGEINFFIAFDKHKISGVNLP